MPPEQGGLQPVPRGVLPRSPLQLWLPFYFNLPAPSLTSGVSGTCQGPPAAQGEPPKPWGSLRTSGRRWQWHWQGPRTAQGQPGALSPPFHRTLTPKQASPGQARGLLSPQSPSVSLSPPFLPLARTPTQLLRPSRAG